MIFKLHITEWDAARMALMYMLIKKKDWKCKPYKLRNKIRIRKLIQRQ
jgi:hypothetical protein